MFRRILYVIKVYRNEFFTIVKNNIEGEFA